MSRILILLYALFCYVLYNGVSVWLGVFLLDIGGLRTGAPAGSWQQAVIVDLGFIALFGIAHSVMARAGFKRHWTRIIPPAAERATYILQSTVFLGLSFWYWQPIPVTIWLIDGWAAILIYGAFGIGVAMITLSTFLLGHLEFVGLQQAWDHLRGTPPRAQKFRTPLLYRIVRHPLQLGVLIALFATPHMTADHLLFAGAMLVYMMIGLWFEERALLREFGWAYATYCRDVPMLIPHPFRTRGRRQTGVPE